MTLQKAGTKIDYTITWLEMDTRPEFDWPHLPVGSTAALLRAVGAPVWWFLTLYDAVGRDYAWDDLHQRDRSELQDWLNGDGMALFTLFDHGWPQGFFLLEGPSEGVVDLTYFGLVPEAVGKGLGTWLLKTAVLTAWDQPGTTKLTVNTCTLDHPRALATYQRHGFTPVRREDRKRVLTRDRDNSRIPS